MSIALTLSGPSRLSAAASASASDASSGGPFAWLQELMGQVPELAQPLILVLAGAIPFFEGEGAAALGVLSGVNPVVAALAAIVGNVLCVAAVVWLGSWVRSGVVERRRRRGVGGAPAGGSGAVAGEPGAGEAVDGRAGAASGGAGGGAGAGAGVSAAGMPAATRVVSRDGVPESKPEKKGQQRLKRWLVKFGVPGASLLAPLALPTMFTAATLVGTGVSKSWVMLWQVIAIVLWTTAVTVVATGVLSVVGG
ncbi:small multidrug efflux protein [Frigoribacterium sp. VKM Ac-1396]|uniref:small multidrug efflux protein n=1 Tax=Frigoribacterium sp. VKM Ac-1396 TaxID=2783821 RepID=UPI001E3CF872|nr:small multidrug efflux protein [Frigoribacterium sp. VKM Ac-1396]